MQRSESAWFGDSAVDLVAPLSSRYRNQETAASNDDDGTEDMLCYVQYETVLKRNVHLKIRKSCVKLVGNVLLEVEHFFASPFLVCNVCVCAYVPNCNATCSHT